MLPAQSPPASSATRSYEPEYIGNKFVSGLHLGTSPLGVLRKDFGFADVAELGETLDGAFAPVPPAADQFLPGKSLAIRTDSGGVLPELSQTIAATSGGLRALAPYANSGAGNFEIRLAYRTGTIERSLFEGGQTAGLSDPLISKLADIFAWDIDFALDLREGDSFVVIYEEKLWFGRKVSDGTILAAEFVNRGKPYRAVAFRGEDGKLSYYTPSGKSLRRSFLRTPVEFSSVSSRFSKARYHPILKMWRAHNGVDYVAAAGTPVRATASGRVVSVGWNGGYGNTVLIDHGGAHSTLYAHLSRYRSGLETGDLVAQGDVIGYVGQTGLATGPHLHYEFQVNGQHQNPLMFNPPDGDEVAGPLSDEFLRLARIWVTRLELISSRHVALR